MLYETMNDEPLAFDPEEIAAGEFLSLGEISDRLVARPEDFTPPFRTLFRWYVENRRQS